eukprot:9388438-Ditylum_brightwellii.AAC.1
MHLLSGRKIIFNIEHESKTISQNTTYVRSRYVLMMRGKHCRQSFSELQEVGVDSYVCGCDRLARISERKRASRYWGQYSIEDSDPDISLLF